MRLSRATVLAALATYFAAGLILGVARIVTGPRSDFHWLGILLVSALWWPALLLGTIVYFLTHR